MADKVNSKTPSSSIDCDSICVSIGASLTGFTVTLNDVESDNSPSDTITSILGIIPLKFDSGYKYKKLFSIDIVPLSISDTLIFKLVLSISVTNISISRKVSSSII